MYVSTLLVQQRKRSHAIFAEKAKKILTLIEKKRRNWIGFSKI